MIESSSSRSDTLEALSVWGLAEGERGAGVAGIMGLRAVFRPRIQERFHLALPVTFPLHTLLKILQAMVLKSDSEAEAAVAIPPGNL